MYTAKLTLTGISGLIMHQDNVTFGDMLRVWQKDPENRKSSVAGDDRSPAWTWLGSLYHDAGAICLPADNLMTCMREGATKIIIKGNTSYKKQAAGACVVDQIAWPLLINGQTIPAQPFLDLLDEKDFATHEAVAKQYGFFLFVKRAKIGQAKHVRVRPRFDQWSASGTVTVQDETITPETLLRFWQQAGQWCGLCDWRPSAPSAPGPWGKFEVSMQVL